MTVWTAIIAPDWATGKRICVVRPSGRWRAGILALSPRLVSPQMRIGDAQQRQVVRRAAAKPDQIAERRRLRMILRHVDQGAVGIGELDSAVRTFLQQL